MIKEISEAEAFELAKAATEWPVIIKVENDETESAVTRYTASLAERTCGSQSPA